MANRKLRVAINGLGRMGRIFLRQNWDNPNLEIVGVQSRSGPDDYAPLIKHDSAYNDWDKHISLAKNGIRIGKQMLRFYESEHVSRTLWKELRVDLVLESTGVYAHKKDSIRHIRGGAKRVLITAPAKEEDQTFVYGVNHETFDAKKHIVISSASCTSTCLATTMQVAKQFDVARGYLTTVHAYTNDQHLVDSPHKKDPRRARAAARSIIPTTTGATRTLEKLLPEFEGKFSGLAYRVPVNTVSLLNLSLELRKPTSKEKVNAAFERAVKGKMKGVLDISYEPLVSVDYEGSPYAATIDGLMTEVVDGKLLNLVVWYDNEWGYIAQISKFINYISKRV
ncbi:MAG: type I glyceraldehyde-3-phosphate dehydrogenase [Candidatus Buchananbacteria bacterium CG10_big_fil_rev_8_21_14_0_10_42_9]|uniref:Type I glyceraldehyde-3-phosphate dehydrogenase n=1 Tax=Candidatus Buchananbacteria bacterium CG10_big_fil_rev_8_21_14_0_10_42_9 TaxID=1974526 RepID=A0A2H0W0P3_9BACT|nr:MAG: type I glyceraldehyde-3-phosphate dehydrogenase [Candidatus Buchananbacteria bacterium CG10_big_fil_rev_8_21_14_0_10_42_9]